MLKTVLFNYYLLCWKLLHLSYIYGQGTQEMVDQGRTQYQLLQERKHLPTYGSCWKSAIEHIDEGCRALSEETQSSMALHLANCFLEMSGHESYNCELEIKTNLKQICLSSMSDRAFHVYTEFYTHTQNICWFLRGQVWQETISENTFRVGKQLEISVKNQEDILKAQRESVALQEKLLQHGRKLEKIMDDFYISTQLHHEVLSVMSTSMKSMQSWLIGEFSWIDMLVFYISTSILVIIFTSSSQTSSARFPIWLLLLLNAVVERLVCTYVLNNYTGNMQDLHVTISQYVWWSRKLFYLFAFFILTYYAYYHHDLSSVNNKLLKKIHDQNQSILQHCVELKRHHVQNLDSEVLIIQQHESSPFRHSSTPVSRNGGADVCDNVKTNESTGRYNLRSRTVSPWTHS